MVEGECLETMESGGGMMLFRLRWLFPLGMDPVEVCACWRGSRVGGRYVFALQSSVDHEETAVVMSSFSV
jgi:hypothetical protein